MELDSQALQIRITLGELAILVQLTFELLAHAAQY